MVVAKKDNVFRSGNGMLACAGYYPVLSLNQSLMMTGDDIL